MTMFSLILFFYLPSFIFVLYANCENQVEPKKQSYNICRFVRDGESCDYKKFDSREDEPCVIGRKAGLTRINGVKVGTENSYILNS